MTNSGGGTGAEPGRRDGGLLAAAVGGSLLVATCAGLLLFSTSARSNVDRAEWMEEVQLANGDMVLVKRAATRDKKGTALSRRGPVRSLKLSFPDNRTVWKSNGALRPLALEIIDGTALLAADVHARELCAKYGNPPGSVLFFRWNEGKWVRISRGEYPKNGRVNLLRDPWGRTSAQDVTGLLKHEDKHARPGNFLVNVPLDQRVEDKSRDACEIYKKL